MNDLNTNINQAISDFQDIKQAIIDKGGDVPQGTPTSKYAEKIVAITTTNNSSDDSIIKEILNESVNFIFANNIQTINTSTDFNTYKTHGVYIVDNTDESMTITNFPVGMNKNGVLIVHGVDTNFIQIYFSPQSKDGVIAIRTCWINWFNWLYFNEESFKNTLGHDNNAAVEGYYESQLYSKDLISNAIKYSFTNKRLGVYQSPIDFNTVLDTGSYVLNPSSNNVGMSMVNFPIWLFRWGGFLVFNLGATVIQMYYPNTENINDPICTKIAFRMYTSGEWGNWVNIQGLSTLNE